MRVDCIYLCIRIDIQHGTALRVIVCLKKSEDSVVRIPFVMPLKMAKHYIHCITMKP